MGTEPTDRALSDRWAAPYRALINDAYLWSVALKIGRPLTTRQRLAGCAAQIWAESYDALCEIAAQHDRLAALVATLPPAWTETASGPPVPERPQDGGEVDR